MLEEDENILEYQLKEIKQPEVKIHFNNNNIEMNALIDTGSNVSCINEDWYELNHNKIGKHETFPLTNVYITTATGQKSKRVKRIILIKSNVLGNEIELQFLIIPSLVQEAILGNDALMTLGAVLNFKDKTIEFNNNKINMITDRCTSVPSHVSETFMNSYEFNQGQSRNNKYNNVNNNYMKSEKFEMSNKMGIVCQLIDHGEKEYNTTNPIFNTNVNKEESNCTIIEKKINEIQDLSECDKQRMMNLLCKYKNVFQDKPGLCNKYKYQIKLKNYEPYKNQNYPVHACYQDTVGKGPNSDSECQHLK